MGLGQKGIKSPSPAVSNAGHQTPHQEKNRNPLVKLIALVQNSKSHGRECWRANTREVMTKYFSCQKEKQITAQLFFVNSGSVRDRSCFSSYLSQCCDKLFNFNLLCLKIASNASVLGGRLSFINSASATTSRLILFSFRERRWERGNPAVNLFAQTMYSCLSGLH